jgi:hypothetical protein
VCLRLVHSNAYSSIRTQFTHALSCVAFGTCHTNHKKEISVIERQFKPVITSILIDQKRNTSRISVIFQQFFKVYSGVSEIRSFEKLSRVLRMSEVFRNILERF